MNASQLKTDCCLEYINGLSGLPSVSVFEIVNRVLILPRFSTEQSSSLSKTYVQHRHEYPWLFRLIESRGLGTIVDARCVFSVSAPAAHIRVRELSTYCGRVLSTTRNAQWDFSDVAMSPTLNFLPGRTSAVDKRPGNALIAIEVAREGRDHESSLVTGLSPTLGYDASPEACRAA